jgi:diguanylate cyclase
MDAELPRQPISANLPSESGRDQYFERATRIAMRALNLPTCAVILDNMGQPEVMAVSGCDAEVVSELQTFYCRTLQCEEAFVVRDALSNLQLAQEAVVSKERGIRFFAGIALRLPCGKPIGILCGMYTMPRRFTREQRPMLADLGQVIEREVRLRRLDDPYHLQIVQTSDRLQAEHALCFETFYRAPVAIARIGRDWEWRCMNDACVKFFAHSRAPLAKTKILDLLDASDRARLEQVVQALDRGRGVEVLTLDVMFRLRNKRSKSARVQVALKQATPARDGDWLLVVQDTQADQRRYASGPTEKSRA